MPTRPCRAAPILLLLCPVQGQPAVEPTEERAFRAGLRHIHENMARGRFQASLTGLQRLLRIHERRPYTFIHKADLLEDFRRCTFYLAHPAPTPGTAIRGRLIRYSPKTGKIEIEYAAASLEDFDEPEIAGDSKRSLRWHPAIWRGPLTLELRGRAYQQTVHTLDRTHEIRLGCCLHLCRTDTGHLEIDFGNRAGTYGARAARTRRWNDDGTRTELVSMPSPATVDQPFTLRVKLGKRDVTAWYQGKALLKTPRPRFSEGRFAIESKGFDTLTVTGTVDPGWVQDRIDHQRQMQRDRFDRRYDAAEVPDWLLDGGIPDRRSFNPSQAWPRDVEDSHLPILRDMVALFEQSEFEELRNYLGDLDRDVLPVDVREYLLARTHSELDEIDLALRHCEKLLEADPTFLTGRQLRASLRIRQGQGEDAAIADYRKMIADHPHARELYVDLAVLLIQAGRAKEAAPILNEAVRRTGNSRELMSLQRMLLSVTRGPGWHQTFEHRSRHYLVRSNIDAAICATAAKILENAHADFTRMLGEPRRRSKDRYRVFLFAGRTGYERFCRDILGERDTHTAGLYSAALKQLLVWNLPNHEAMLRTIRHEGLHQFLDSMVHDAPAWLNEGLAENFEAAADGARATDGDAFRRDDHLRLLAKRPLMPTARFVAMPFKVFYRGSGENYAQAWALVHLLRHGPETWRPILPALLAQLGAGNSPRAAVRRAFQGVDFKRLDADLAAWLEGMRRTR